MDLNKLAEADYANMMEQLGIKEMKPGRNPNTTDVTQHPNYDELIGNPYCIYPELLVTKTEAGLAHHHVQGYLHAFVQHPYAPLPHPLFRSERHLLFAERIPYCLN